MEQRLRESMRRVSLGYDPEAMIMSSKALMELGEYNMAAATLEELVGAIPGEVEEVLAECRRLKYEERTGNYDPIPFQVVSRHAEQLPINVGGITTGFFSLEPDQWGEVSGDIQWGEPEGPLGKFISEKIALGDAGGVFLRASASKGELLFAINPLVFVTDAATDLDLEVKNRAMGSTRIRTIFTHLVKQASSFARKDSGAGEAGEAGTEVSAIAMELLRVNQGLTITYMEEPIGFELDVPLLYPFVICARADDASVALPKAGFFTHDMYPTAGFRFKGIWHLLALMRHSCDSNIAITFKGPVAFARASRDLKSGDELFCCNANVDPLEPFEVRHMRLIGMQKFFSVEHNDTPCECRRCTVETRRFHLNLDDVEEDGVLLAGRSFHWLSQYRTKGVRACLVKPSEVLQGIVKNCNGGYYSCLPNVTLLCRYLEDNGRGFLRELCIGRYGEDEGETVTRELTSFVDKWMKIV